MRYLNLAVSSFLSDHFHSFEYILLANDVILLSNIREGHEVLEERRRRPARMFNTSRKPSPTRVRVCLSLQDQSAIKWTPRMHPYSVFYDPHMDGKIIS